VLKVKPLYERFQEDYVAVKTPCDNKDGFRIDYVYYSPWFLWDLPEDELKKRKHLILAEGLLSLAVYIIAAAIPCWLNAMSVVAFPALVSLMVLCVELFGIGQFYFAKYRTTRFTFEVADRRLKLWPLLNAIASALAVGGCVWCMLVYGASFEGVTVTLGYTAEMVLSVLIRSQYGRIPFTTEKNDTLKKVEPVFSR